VPGEHAELPGAASRLEARQERVGARLVPGQPDRLEVQLSRLDFLAERFGACDKHGVAPVAEGLQRRHKRELVAGAGQKGWQVRIATPLLHLDRRARLSCCDGHA
jgi:predicted metal-dependent phosphoesterase TrpH